MESIKPFLTALIRRSGALTLDFFGRAAVTHTKEDETDVVTEADIAVSRLIVSAIREHYPDHGIISEEEDGVQTDKEYIWIIDPIDGTRNYATHTPLFGVSIAVARRGVVEYGAIYLPVTDELYYAQKGKGAFLNGESIKCSQRESLDMSYGIGFTVWHEGRADIIESLINEAKKYKYWIMGTGSVVVSACYVASGRRDWFFYNNCNVWDYAAASVILLESGCRVTNFKGEDWALDEHEFIAANRMIHGKLLEIIKGRT